MTKISKIKFLTMQNIYKEKKIYGNSKTVILEIETNNGIIRTGALTREM